MSGSKCMVCQKKVIQYVGYDKPLPKVSMGGGSEGNWWESESQIGGLEAGSDKVITMLLDEDRVCGLHGVAPPPYM
ncbi:hypothetical protein BT96DRAFT_167133 [Gymnopus androsaceus JB14]|uniref:Uncharacterized protein n=1 Tax=Gymnopus androsaceus JB14 TaxID=1447944 RepID=A0A6A4HCB8_9AGAR|nr:hypothetical protein BT96DRAFT_167133 [Gymnopus androsaceus JB14]